MTSLNIRPCENCFKPNKSKRHGSIFIHITYRYVSTTRYDDGLENGKIEK